MSPQDVLARVLEAGGRIVPDLERPRLLVPPALKPLVAAHRGVLRPLVLYREALWRWWELTAQRRSADREEVNRTYQEILRLLDEVGEPTATRLRRQWAHERYQETGVCPYCGERGPYHDPDRGGEAADA